MFDRRQFIAAGAAATLASTTGFAQVADDRPYGTPAATGAVRARVSPGAPPPPDAAVKARLSALI